MELETYQEADAGGHHATVAKVNDHCLCLDASRIATVRHMLRHRRVCVVVWRHVWQAVALVTTLIITYTHYL